MTKFGIPGQNQDPLAYTSNRTSVVPCVEASRIPTTEDTKYPLWTEWRVGKNPTTGTEGDFYKLTKATGGSATWSEIAIADSVTTTKGDLIVRNATTDVRLPVGTNGQVLTADSTDDEGMVWADPYSGLAPSSTMLLYDDFMTTASPPEFSQTSGVTYGSQDFTAGWRPGMCRLRTSSATQVYINTDNDTLRVGNGVVVMETSIFLSNLSTGVDEYTFCFGLTDDGFDTTPSDGVLLRYDRAANGVNWFSYSASTSTVTSNDTGVAVTENTWIRLRIEINAAASSIAFYIDGTLVDTITTNIPSSTFNLEMTWTMDRDIASGAVNRDCWVDYAFLQIEVPR